MAEQTLYTSHNNYSSLQTQGGGTDTERRLGWCAAASALWCKNTLDAAIAPKDSDPGKLRAGILQVKFRWDPNGNGQDVLTLLGNVDLHGVQVANGVTFDALMDAVTGTPGVYWLSNYGHATAVDTRAGRELFYDIENGLFQYANSAELRQGIRARYGNSPRWRAFRVTAA